jgi:hypothetical protein
MAVSEVYQCQQEKAQNGERVKHFQQNPKTQMLRKIKRASLRKTDGNLER